MYTLSFLLFMLIYVYIFSVLAILSSLLEIFFPYASPLHLFLYVEFFSFKYLRVSVALLPYFSCQSSSYWLTNMAKVENSASLFNSSISLSHPSSQASFFGYIASYTYSTINHGAIILIIQSNPQKQTKLSSCLAFLFSSSCSTAVITTTAITVMPMPVMMMIVIKLYVKSGSLLSLST